MDDNLNPWWMKFDQPNERDIPKVVQGKMAKVGAPKTEFGQITEAYNQANMGDTTNKLAQALGMTPPMSSDMAQNSQYYQDYMESVVNGEPMRKQGMVGGPVLPTSAQGGIPPYTDPTNSQTRWGIPTWKEDTPPELKKETQRQARSWCRWYYHNHPVVPTCMDIYAKYPFVGLDLQCPDPKVEEDYKTIFFDILNYEEFLPNAALQYWVNGEVAIMGQWNDKFGGWVEENVVNSDDVDVINWPGPAENKEAFLWYPPADLQLLLKEQDPDDPRYLYMLDNYGDELIQWMEGNPSELPTDVFSLLRFKTEVEGGRGFPILMRAFGKLMLEEKLNQAMTAVADRLYTPFIVVKLGSKDLLQGKYPWMPTEAQMKAMQAHLEMVMISKYRLMVYHSGIEFENPFKDMTIPDLQGDFDRITTEILNVFGISKELIQGGSQGTYASGAMSAQIMMQQLATTQQKWTRWWIVERAMKIAEARGYYELEKKGLTYTKPTETVPVWDPVTREMQIVERRKRMVPSIRMATMDWRDEETKARGLMELRRQFGVPVSDQRLISFYDTDLDVDDERQVWAEERETMYEVTQQLGPAAPQERPGMGGGGAGMPGMGGPPGGRGIPGGAPGSTPGGAAGGPGSRPPESDNMRSTQPNTGGPPNPQSEPVMTSYQGDYITVSGGNDRNLKVGELETKTANEKIVARSEDEVKENIQKTAKYKKNYKSAQNSYSDYDGPMIFRKTGKQKGTLYFMRGNRLMATRTK